MNLSTEKLSQVNILWTGGWDSTFQLMKLLVIERKSVMPFYIIHAERRSTRIELLTMMKIKDAIISKYPFTRKLLHPLQIYMVDEILPDDEISNAFHNVLKQRHIGGQYEWLARFCKQFELEEMQMCIQRHIYGNDIESTLAYNLQEERITKEEKTLFKYFTFPLINATKQDMKRYTIEQEWEEIMEKTWFCHKPTRNLKPCGYCGPCRIAIKEKFAYRIPVTRRVLSFFYRTIFFPLKPIAKKILNK